MRSLRLVRRWEVSVLHGRRSGKRIGPLLSEAQRRRQRFEPFPFLQMPFNEGTPKISPDGRFMAYCSDEWGQFEIHVQPFPEGRGNWPVSTNGGCQPRWSRDGKDLFYVAGDTLLAVAVTTTPSFSFSVPDPLFRNPIWSQLIAIRSSTTSRPTPAVCLSGNGGKRRRQAGLDPCSAELVRQVPRPRAGLSPPKRTT